MKTVAIVLNSSWYGYNFRLNLARDLKKEGFRVVFMAHYDSKYSELIKEEFEFFSLDVDAKGVNPINDTKLMIDMYKRFRQVKPDIVLNYTIKPNIYSSIVAKICGIKSINNVTGLGTIFIEQTLITKIAKMLYKIAFSCANKVFFQNKDDLGLFVDNGLVDIAKTGIVAGSGVDLVKFSPRDSIYDDDKIRFLMIARVLRDKGICEYVEASSILKQKYPNIECQLLGEVNVANKTAVSKDEVDKWVSDGLITYLGKTDKVEEYIANVDCVVLPSYREGTPRSLLEASSMSKPIVTTNTIGCKEVVDDGVNGYLCEVKSGIDLANKMEKIINLTKEDREKMGSNGRKKILNEYDEKIVINKYIATIRELI